MPAFIWAKCFGSSAGFPMPLPRGATGLQSAPAISRRIWRSRRHCSRPRTPRPPSPRPRPRCGSSRTTCVPPPCAPLPGSCGATTPVRCRPSRRCSSASRSFSPRRRSPGPSRWRSISIPMRQAEPSFSLRSRLRPQRWRACRRCCSRSSSSTRRARRAMPACWHRSLRWPAIGRTRRPATTPCAGSRWRSPTSIPPRAARLRHATRCCVQRRSPRRCHSPWPRRSAGERTRVVVLLPPAAPGESTRALLSRAGELAARRVRPGRGDDRHGRGGCGRRRVRRSRDGRRASGAAGRCDRHGPGGARSRRAAGLRGPRGGGGTAARATARARGLDGGHRGARERGAARRPRGCRRRTHSSRRCARCTPGTMGATIARSTQQRSRGPGRTPCARIRAAIAARARAAYTRMLELQPGFAPAHYLRGLVARDEDDTARARADFAAALAAAPMYVDARLAAARAATEAHEPEACRRLVHRRPRARARARRAVAGAGPRAARAARRQLRRPTRSSMRWRSSPTTARRTTTTASRCRCWAGCPMPRARTSARWHSIPG